MTIAVDRDVVAGEGLTDDVRDDATVIGAHARSVSVENPRHANVDTPGAGEIERQCLGGALSLIVAGTGALYLDSRLPQ